MDEDLRIIDDPEAIAEFEAEEQACRERWQRKHPGQKYVPLEQLVVPESEPFAPPNEQEKELWKTFRRQKKS